MIELNLSVAIAQHLHEHPPLRGAQNNPALQGFQRIGPVLALMAGAGMSRGVHAMRQPKEFKLGRLF
ncbi:hypothetical protein CO670_29825 [Rhizobium sp. J15]|nr:hypothetical protein CO670_29825 [Rhizobium sp. J15]